MRGELAHLISANKITNMKMKRTLVGILVMMLLIGTSFVPATEAQASTKVGTTTVKVKNTDVGANLKVAWKEVSGASGYVVYASRTKLVGYKKVKTTTGTSYTTSKVSKNRTYYFKVKAYTTVDEKNVYGSYSKVVSCKTSKYLLNTVIDEGGKEVYFYWLWDGKSAMKDDNYWTTWNKCQDVISKRYNNNTHGKMVGSSRKDPALYYVSGKIVAISTPHFSFDGSDYE